MPTSCYYPSFCCCCCCLGQVEYLTESRAKFVLTAWLSVLDVPFPLPLSTTVCHWVRSIILICCSCMFYEVSVLSILSPNEFIRPNLKWQPIVAIFGGGNPRLSSSLCCILACNSLWIHMTLLKNEEPTQNAIYRKLQSKGHSATGSRDTKREKERDTTWMSNVRREVETLRCLLMAQYVVGMKSNKCQEKSQKAYREKRERDWKGSAISRVKWSNYENVLNIMLVFHFASLICPSQQLLQLVLANSQLVEALLNCFNLFHADYIASCYKAYGPTQLGTRCIRNNPHIVGRE